MMKKPRLLYAWQLVCQGLSNENVLSRLLCHSSKNENSRLSDTDIEFLRDFLSSRHVKHCLELIDVTTFGANQEAIVHRLRPADAVDRDSLRALSDLWVDLEQFVMQTRETDEPEAHELYDLLADPHIREVLVAYDDIANSRYTTEDFDLVPLDTCADPGQRRSASRSPVSSHKRSPKRDSLRSIEDSLGEITVVSDLKSVANTHHNRSPLNAPCELSECDENGDKEHLTGDYSTRHVQSRMAPNASGTDQVQRTSHEAPSQGVHSQESLKSSHSVKSSAKPVGGANERSNSLSRPRKENNLADSQSDSEISLGTIPKDDHHGSTAGPRQFHDSSRSRNSNHPQSQKSRLRSTSQTSASKSPILTSRNSAHKNAESQPPSSPRLGANPASVDVRRNGSRRESANYPSTSLPDRNYRHSRSSRAGATQSPVQGTRSLPQQTSRQSNRSSKDAQSVKVPQPGEIRVIHLRRDHPGEPIGITIAMRTPSPPVESTGSSKAEPVNPNRPVLTIQRIMAGSLADRNGSLFPGDQLLEFNNYPVSSLEQVHSMMQQMSSALTCDLKVKAPNNVGFLRPGLQYKHNPSKTKRYIRTFFDYDASRDALMPTGDVGLSFRAGDVLELVDDQDPNWWQVRPLTGSRDRTRLIPSQTLEERRRAFNQEKAQATSNKKMKKKIKQFFHAADSSALRLRSDIWSYEEVVPWPQSMVPCLLLLGPYGVGRRTLKILLVTQEPDRFAYPISDTTDPSAPGNNFRILTKAQMEDDVRSGAYVEWGKVDGHYYGIRFSAVRKIIASGRTAVIDCQPQSVHLLHQPEFNPCTVFIAAPSFEVTKQMLDDGIRLGLTKNTRSDDELRNIIEESRTLAAQYRHLYTHLLTNSNMNESVSKLSRLVSRLEKQPSWIPSGWAYELSVPTMTAHRSNGSVFVPGSSSLSALGIQGLPPYRPSTITRSVLSGISEASAQSASRLARPPSISSSGGLRDSHRGKPDSWRRLYEKRRKPQIDYRPLSPAIPEQDTPSESVASHSIEPSSRPARPSASETHRSASKPHATPTGLAKVSSARLSDSHSRDSHQDPGSNRHAKPISPKANSRSQTALPVSRTTVPVSKDPGQSDLLSRGSKHRLDSIENRHSEQNNEDEISSTSSEDEDEDYEDERSADLLV